MDMVYLRDRVAAMEEMNDQARQAIEKLDEIVEKLRSPAFRVGTFLMPVEPDKAHVCVGGTDYVCRVDPQIPLASLQMGQRVLCNEAFAIVQGLGFDRNGPIVRIDELLSDGRLRIGQEAGLMLLGAVAFGAAGQGKTQARHGSAAGCQSARRAGSHRRGQAHRAVAGNGDRAAVVGDRRPGRGGAGDSRHHRTAVFAPGFVQAVRAHCAQGLFAARAARLRQDAAGQGDGLQSAPANPDRRPAWIIRNFSCTSKARKS